MKEGTGGDPFSDDIDVDESNEAESTDASGGSEDTMNGRGEQNRSAEKPETGSADRSEPDDSELPWAVERNSVKSEREMVQFYLRNFVQERETEFQRRVEDTAGYDTYLTDVREAAYLVAMEHPEEVAQLLDEWGCEYA